MAAITRQSVLALPKTEIHLHLEGSATAEILVRLARKYETELSRMNAESLSRRMFQYQDFQQFLKTYKTVCEHLRDAEDYLLILDWLAEYFQQENIRYAEIFYSPSIAWRFDRDGRHILQALLERASVIEASQPVTIRWILDCVRQWGQAAAEKTAELAAEFRDFGVVGLGLGGDENSVPANEFAEVFAWARAHQLYVHVHAGEIGEPQQIWDGLQILGANRIGHGIHAARDPHLMEYLKERAIGLDICLTSNLKTGAWRMLARHPFRLLHQRGIPVTLSTDDPGLFETRLSEEYLLAAQHFGLTRFDLHYIILQGARSSFLAHREKMKLMEELNLEIQNL